jgi:HemY protein
VASLPSDKGAAIESSPFEDAMLAAPPPKRIEAERKEIAEPPRDDVVVPLTPAAQDNAPIAPASAEPANPVAVEPAPPAAAATAPAQPESAPARPAPLFRTRQDIPKTVPQVIPIVRAPDDPGVDDEAPTDEFSEQIGTPKAQAGGWRGFLSRWGS